MADVVEKGRCKFYNATKGWGFIIPDNGGKELFVHASELEDDEELQTDDRVEFEVAQGKKGPVAKKVKVLR